MMLGWVTTSGGLCPICLWGCYGVRGTDIAYLSYLPPELLRDVRTDLAYAICLRGSCGVCGTDLAYGATGDSLRQDSNPQRAYGATSSDNAPVQASQRRMEQGEERGREGEKERQAVLLCGVPYWHAMCGTDAGYAATRAQRGGRVCCCRIGIASCCRKRIARSERSEERGAGRKEGGSGSREQRGGAGRREERSAGRRQGTGAGRREERGAERRKEGRKTAIYALPKSEALFLWPSG
eukprot:2635007-Rhodomonas_salina.1